MNTFLNTMKNNTNYGLTENLSLSHKTTRSDVLDMFALGGSMRQRSDTDCINLFKNAMAEDANLAMKCLFYLADVRGGQGERRFFRVCFNWLAKEYPDIARKNLENIPFFTRWDNILYATINTPLFNDALAIVKHQLALDVQSQTPSLCAKWCASENTSSQTTRNMASHIRNYLGMTHKEYRKMLSVLRSRINIVEKLMSEGRFDEIQFDKIPSKAGLIYRNAFAKHDFDRYNEFMQSKETKVKAAVLNPVDIAAKTNWCNLDINDPSRIMLNKAWENLPDYYNGREENGLCIVDVSGSMSGQPMDAAVSLGAYISERGHGPFANHFITFSTRPSLEKFEGVDIVDKFQRCRRADWGYNTDIEAVFDLMLNTLKNKHTDPNDVPSRLYILSDMQFDCGICERRRGISEGEVNTLLEQIAKDWSAAGYELPQVVFWNLRACDNAIPAIGGRFSYVSGFSPAILDSVLSGKTGYEMMLDKLLSDRYKPVTA